MMHRHNFGRVAQVRNSSASSLELVSPDGVKMDFEETKI